MTQKNRTSVSELYRYPVKSLGGEAIDTLEVLSSGFAGDRLWAFRDVARNEISSAKRAPLLLQISARTLENGQAELTFPNGETLATDAPGCAETVSAFVGREQALFGLHPATDAAYFARAEIAPEKFDAYVREVLGLHADEPLPDFSKLPPEALKNTTLPGTYFDAATIHIILASELRQLQETLPGVTVGAARFRPNIVLDDLAAPLASVDLIGKTVQIGSVILRIDHLVPRCSMTTHQQGALAQAPQIMRRLVQDWKHSFGVYGSVAQPGQIRTGDGFTFSA